MHAECADGGREHGQTSRGDKTYHLFHHVQRRNGRKRCVISDTDRRGEKSPRLEQRKQAKARRMEHVEITMANGQRCGGSIPERVSDLMVRVASVAT